MTFRTRHLRGLILAALALLGPLGGPSPSAAQQAPVTTNIATDGTLPGRDALQVGGVPELGGSGEIFEIGEDLGVRAGNNLFHSFDVFDVGAGDTARFTALAPVDNLISRVTGGAASRIDGKIQSLAGEQNFFFLNPNGVMFGPGAQLDVPGSFHASTADELRFGNPTETFSAIAPAGSVLAISNPTAFGFLSSEVGQISVAPRQGEGRLEVRRGRDISLIAGDITIDGGIVSAQQGDVRLVAVASPGEVSGVLGPIDELTLTGFESLGTVQIIDGAKVSSSALSPFFEQARPGFPTPPQQLSGFFIDADGAESTLSTLVPVIGDAFQFGDVTVFEGSFFDLVLRPTPRPQDGAGDIAVRASDLHIRDAEIRATNTGDQPGGSISIDLTGDLKIERLTSPTNVGILAETGVRIRGSQTFIDDSGMTQTVPAEIVIAGSGDGGDISIRARNVQMEGGASISTRSFSAGAAGSIDVQADGVVSLSGSRADLGSTPDLPLATSLLSSTQGLGEGGDLRLSAQELRLADGAALISQTTTDADAGDVVVEVDRLTIEGRSQIDSSTSAQSTLRPVLYIGNSGQAGDIFVRASESISITGDGTSRSGEFAHIRSSSQAESIGDAGQLRIETPELTMDRTAGIEVVTRGAGTGGEIIVDARVLELDGASYISGRSFAAAGAPELMGGTAGDAGSIVVSPLDARFATRDVRLRGQSEIVTSAVSAEGGDITLGATGTISLDGQSGIDASDTGGEGGNVLIPALDSETRPELVVVNGASRILARAAVAGGDGGFIRISADSVFVSPDSVIDAENQVIIDSPDSNLESGLVRPVSDFLDPSSLVRPTCAARAEGKAGGSFSVATARNIPIAPGDLLLAYDRLDRSAASAPGSAPSTNGTRGGAERMGSLLERAQQEQSRGDFGASFETLRGALAEAEASGDRVATAESLGSLARSYMALGEIDEADRLLDAALERAQQAEDSELRGTLTHAKGNLALRGQRFDAAVVAFDETSAIAKKLGDHPLRAKALSNAARAALMLDADDERARLRLERALENLDELEPGVSRVQTQIHLARSLALYAERAGSSEDPRMLLRAHSLLASAAREAAELDDAYLESYALGHLGALYLAEGRNKEALHLTREAISRGEETGALDALSRWTWQEGRLLWEAGRTNASLDSMERAVRYLEEARQAVIFQNGAAGSVDFRASVAPIYLDLTDRLLQASDLAARPADRDALLRRARSVVELFKAAELRDYFRDQCVADLEARTINPDELAQGAAVVYPISLPDRLELLVTLPSGIQRFTVDVARPVLRDLALDFGNDVLGQTNRYRRSGGMLHRALVAPYEKLLEQEKIGTIVFVPDGVLRTIPFAALWDGDQFLIERYALSVTPVLEVVDPKPLDRKNLRPLIAGISEAVGDFSALPAVATELDSIQARVGGRVLLNDAFRIDRFEREIAARRPDIIHIASHAVFASEPSQSFLLAYDGRLGFDRFRELMQTTRFRDEPVELLVLSACETAAGNDRAALGLAGVAIRSGVRSAIGSLWRVDDQRTAELFDVFYETLEKPGVSRARALQAAQVDMIDAGPLTRHPRNWAAFLLISSWL